MIRFASAAAARMPVAVTRSARALVLVVLMSSAAQAAAQSSIPDLSIEDLMKLDGGQVYGASERLQPVMEAPASVSFISAADIARYGYRTLADILRSVRGMYITDDRRFSLIGTRGFAKPGDYNSRILLLINGHRVNDNIFGQAEVGTEFGLDAAIFERVEVIRGPASSLYGDSAFFAVVNVITRTGASLDGGTLTVETGNLGTRLARASVGRGFGKGVDIAVSGTYQYAGGVERLYFPAFDTPATNNGVAEGLDGEGARMLYARVGVGGLTITSAYGSRDKDVPTAASGTLFNAQNPKFQATNRHTLVDGEYRRTVNRARVVLRATFDKFSNNSILPFSLAQTGQPAVSGRSASIGTRWSVGGEMTRTLPGRQTLTAGVDAIDNVRQDQSARFSYSPVPLFDSRGSSVQQAVYLQDEIRVAPWLIVNGGLRYDRYQTFSRATPRAALIVLPSAAQSVKYLYGSAFRAPNAYELNAFFFGPRIEQLRPESIDTHELVWERYVNNWLRTSVSTYWYQADRLITVVVDASTLAGYSFVNDGQVRAKGLELEGQMRLMGESRALVSYALQSAIDQQTRAELSNSPRHVAKARISVPLPINRSVVSIEGQYLSSRATLTGSRVSGATSVNLTVIQPLTARWELFGGLRNLFDVAFADPASSQNRQASIPQNGRTVRIGLRLKVWTP